MKVFRVEHAITGYGPYASHAWPDSDECFCAHPEEDIPQAYIEHRHSCEYGRRVSLSLELNNLHSFDDEHPPPAEDGIGPMNPNIEVCGFLTLADLRAWFDIVLRQRLHAHGYVCRPHEVDASTIRKGTRQIVFEPGERLTALRLI